MLQVGDAGKFPHAVGFEGLDHLFRVSQQGPCFTATEEDGGDKRLEELKLACRADGASPPEPIKSRRLSAYILFVLVDCSVAGGVPVQTLLLPSVPGAPKSVYYMSYCTDSQNRWIISHLLTAYSKVFD